MIPQQPPPQPVGYTRSPLGSHEAAVHRPSPLRICHPTERRLKRAHSTETVGDGPSGDPASSPADQDDHAPSKRFKDEEDVSRLLHTSPTISPSSSSASIVAVYSSSRPPSPGYSHDTSKRSSPAGERQATSKQVVKENAAPRASMEKGASSLPAKEKANDSGTAATEDVDRWDDHFCDPTAGIFIRSNDGVKFRMSACEVFATMFASSALSAEKPIDIDACETVVRALLELTVLPPLHNGTKFNFFKLGLAHHLQLLDLAETYGFSTIKKEATKSLKSKFQLGDAPHFISLASGRGDDVDLALRAVPYLQPRYFEPSLSPGFKGTREVWLSRLAYYFTLPKYHSPLRRQDGTTIAQVTLEHGKAIARLFKNDMEALDGTAE